VPIVVVGGGLWPGPGGAGQEMAHALDVSGCCSPRQLIARSGDVRDRQSLYNMAAGVRWDQYMTIDQTLG
jgi:hypothetical protein